MDYQQFSQQLKKLSITKKKFALITGLSQASVTNWKGVNKVPSWVEPFLICFAKARAYDVIKDIIKDIDEQPSLK